MADSESNDINDSKSFMEWVKDNIWKIIFSLGIIGLILFLICWFRWENEDTDLSLVDELQIASVVLPELVDGPVIRVDWKYDNFSINTNLSYQLPDGWSKTSDIDENLTETVNLRSPEDKYGFYYCLDLKEYALTTEVDLAMTADILAVDPTFTADGIGKPLNLLTYRQLGAAGGFHTTVIDDTSVSEGQAVDFTESIVNPVGRSLQILGQMNCDNPEAIDFTLTDYLNSQLYAEAAAMLNSTQY